MDLPVRHGEGKFYAAQEVIDQIVEQQLIALQYARPDGQPADGAFPENPNGSLLDIAGICDPTGRIFGLMPHPERATHLRSQDGKKLWESISTWMENA